MIFSKYQFIGNVSVMLLFVLTALPAKPYKTTHNDLLFIGDFEAFVCEAKGDCYYASPGASDVAACSYDDPCDLLTARDLLSGGDYLYLLAGTYADTYTFTEGAYGDYEMVMAFGRTHSFPAPQPTPTNRITIKAYPSHVVIIDGNYDINTNSGAQCFYTDQSYITFSGLNFHDCRTGINIGENRISADVVGTVVVNNNFTGTHFVNDNGGNITIYSDAIDTTILNNHFDGPGSAVGSMNSAGIYFTHDRGAKILNNDISNHRTGIHYKHDRYPSAGDTGSEIAYNYIHNVSIAARLNNRYIHIHNNIATATAGSFSINHCSGAAGEGGDYNTINNNYFHDLHFNGCSDTNVDQGAYQNSVKNNIIASRFFLHPWRSTPHETTMDHNLYIEDIFENNVVYTLNQWQTYHGQDANSVTGTPTFSDPGLNVITDYQLLPGSLGYQADENGQDMGPDVSAVGRF